MSADVGTFPLITFPSKTVPFTNTNDFIPYLLVIPKFIGLDCGSPLNLHRTARKVKIAITLIYTNHRIMLGRFLVIQWTAASGKSLRVTRTIPGGFVF
jgi:hypothetical protein